jgi:hypothetical protein
MATDAEDQMADTPPAPPPDEETPTPRWVYYVAGVVVIVVTLALGAMHLLGGAIPQHGPP